MRKFVFATKTQFLKLFPHTPPFVFSSSYELKLQEVWLSLISITYYSQGSFFIVFFCIVKGTVSVISSYYQCKDGNVRFTAVALEALSDQVLIRHQCY